MVVWRDPSLVEYGLVLEEPERVWEERQVCRSVRREVCRVLHAEREVDWRSSCLHDEVEACYRQGRNGKEPHKASGWLGRMSRRVLTVLVEAAVVVALPPDMSASHLADQGVLSDVFSLEVELLSRPDQVETSRLQTCFGLLVAEIRLLAVHV